MWTRILPQSITTAFSTSCALSALLFRLDVRLLLQIRKQQCTRDLMIRKALSARLHHEIAEDFGIGIHSFLDALETLHEDPESNLTSLSKDTKPRSIHV